MVKLAESILVATNAYLCDFQNIPQTYTDLILRGIGRCDQAGAVVGFGRFNNDPTGNYDYTYIVGTSGSVSCTTALGAAGMYWGWIPGAATNANMPGAFEIVIPCYRDTTWWKTALAKMGAGAVYDIETLNTWHATVAINRIQIVASAGAFLAGSRVALYGVG